MGHIDSASFKVYRRGGDIGETDEETHSESATDALGTSEDDGSDGEDLVTLSLSRTEVLLIFTTPSHLN